MYLLQATYIIIDGTNKPPKLFLNIRKRNILWNKRQITNVHNCIVYLTCNETFHILTCTQLQVYVYITSTVHVIYATGLLQTHCWLFVEVLCLELISHLSKRA